MESVAPTLKLVIQTKFDLKQGLALYDSLQLQSQENTEVGTDLKQYLYKFDQDLDIYTYPSHFSVYRKTLFNLFSEGLRGCAISEKLQELEQIITQECRRHLEESCVILPYKGLLPLMLLMFPALVILILGPILMEFLEVIG